MAGYNELKGLRVKYLSADPANPEDGQVWYNSTTGNLRVQGIGVAAWSSAAPTINARSEASHGGTQTAAIISGGSPGNLTSTEEYNGSGWSAGGALNTGRLKHGGAGIQTATLVFGGVTTPPSVYQTVNESYDGTSWTEEADLSTARYNGGNGCGTQTSALYSGGWNGSNLDNTEEWNGTSWTAGTAYPTIIRDFPLVGTQDAALGFGGYTPPVGSATPGLANSYNGSTWTSVTAMNTGRANLTGGGIQTYAIGAGGYRTPTLAPTANTEIWDGTSWTESADLATARRSLAGSKSGTASAFLGCTGYTAGSPAGVSLTEEYNFSSTTVTPAAWSSGGALNTGRLNVSMGGTQTAGIVLGGHISPGAEPAGVETYDGSSFSVGTPVGPYPADYAAYAGSQTAGIIFGGAPYSTNSAVYDGEWAAGPALNTGRSQLMGAGTQTAALAIGGFTGGVTSTTAAEEYDGASWTAGGSMSTQRGRGAGFGIQTAALATGGNTSPDTTLTVDTEEYNGSAWTAGGDLITATGLYIGGWGTQTDGIVVGGGTPSYVSTTLGYDGTAWSTRPSATYAAGRTQTAGADGSAGLRAGGGPNTSQRDGSEEFTGEVVTTNPANNLSVS